MPAPDEHVPPPAADVELLSFLAHELRTPVTVAAGTLSMLESGTYDPLPEAHRHVIVLAMQSVARLQTMADDLSLVARIGRNEWPLHRSVVAISDIIADVADTLHSVNPATRVDIPSDASGATAVVDRLAVGRAVASLARYVIREMTADTVALRIVPDPGANWLVLSAPGPIGSEFPAALGGVDPSTPGSGFALHAASALLAMHDLGAVRFDVGPDAAAVGVAFPR